MKRFVSRSNEPLTPALSPFGRGEGEKGGVALRLGGVQSGVGVRPFRQCGVADGVATSAGLQYRGSGIGEDEFAGGYN